MKRDLLIAKLASIRPALEAEGVAHIALFGSRARGDDSIASDLDILIDVAPRKKFSIIDLVSVEHVIGDATGLAANAFMRRSLDAAFTATIARDVIEIF